MASAVGTSTRARRVLALLALGPLGCTTSYEPAKSPRIAIVDDGTTFLKDGQRYDGGSGLIEAVAGNPQAEEMARTAYRNQVAGTVLYVAGFPIVIGGPIVGAALDDEKTGKTVALASLGTGIAVWITSIVFLSHVQPQRLDAINIYNDSVSPEPPRGAPEATAAPEAPAPE
jgi:hypothetical protein